MGQETIDLSKLCRKENQELGASAQTKWEEGAGRAGALSWAFLLVKQGL